MPFLRQIISLDKVIYQLQRTMNETNAMFLFHLNNSNADNLYNVSSDLSLAEDAKDSQSTTGMVNLQAQLTLTRFVVQRILTPLVVIFGVVGNMVNIAVLTRRWMKSSTNCYLTALAVCDILYLIFALTMSFSHYPSIRSQPSYIRYKYLFGKQLADTCSNTGVWLTLTFTIERYIGVCLPMKGKRWCTPRRARYITIAVCVVAALVTFPEFFESTIVTGVNSSNETIVKRKPSRFGSTPSYGLGYIYVNQALFTLLPLVLLLVFNTLLIRAVLNAARQRKAMSKVTSTKSSGSRSGGSNNTTRPHRQQSDQQKITIMLIIVVIVFLLCQLPQAVQKLYLVYLQVTDRVNAHTMDTLKITGNVFNLLVMLNASTNFVLYSCFSTKFRRTFSRLFCQCWRFGSRNRLPEALFTEVTSTHQTPLAERETPLLQQTPGNATRSKRFSGHWPNQSSLSAAGNATFMKEHRGGPNQLRETLVSGSTRASRNTKSSLTWSSGRHNGYSDSGQNTPSSHRSTSAL